MLFILLLFIFLVYGGWAIGKSIGNVFFGKDEYRSTYVDKTTHIHHHYHDNRSIRINDEEFRNLKK